MDEERGESTEEEVTWGVDSGDNILSEDDVGARARVTTDEERVLRKGWKIISGESRVVVRNFLVDDSSLYLMYLVILSKWRDESVGDWLFETWSKENDRNQVWNEQWR